MRRHTWILALAGLLFLVAAALYRGMSGELGATGWGLAGLGFAGVLAWMALDRARLEQVTGSRAFRYGAGATALAVAALGIGVALNFLAHRYDHRWDVTSSGRYTLSEQTVKVAGALDRPVQVVAFFEQDSPEHRSFRDLVEGYRRHASNLEVEFHDPMREPFLAQQFSITSRYGTVILVSGDDRQRLEASFDEEALTNALIRLTSGVEHTICFTTEHGELDPDDDMEPFGLGLAGSKLEDQNYRVEKLSMLREGGVPDRCDVVVVAAPRVDLLPVEREAFARYLVDGGAALVLLEPLEAPETARDISRYGLDLREDLLLEDNPQAQRIGLDASFVVVGEQQLDFHPITDGLTAGLLFQTARSVSKAEDVPIGLNVQELARTSPQAWGETTLDGSQPAAPDGDDLVGEVPLMALVEITDPAAVPVRDVDLLPVDRLELPLLQATPGEDEEGKDEEGKDEEGKDEEGKDEEEAREPGGQPGGRLVVVGDSSFATNQLLLQGMNQDLFLNTVAWLVEEEDQLSIRPNKSTRGRLEVTVAQGVLVWFLSIFGIPGLALAGAVATWIRRRKL